MKAELQESPSESRPGSATSAHQWLVGPITARRAYLGRFLTGNYVMHKAVAVSRSGRATSEQDTTRLRVEERRQSQADIRGYPARMQKTGTESGETRARNTALSPNGRPTGTEKDSPS